MAYDAVLVDNDGILVELTGYEALERAVRETFIAFGVGEPLEDHVEALLINVPIERLEAVCGLYGIDPGAFWARRDRTISNLECDLIRRGEKGLYDDVAELWGLDRPLGIVSNNVQPTIDFILDHFDIRSRFTLAYGREPSVEGLRRRKPNPYYLRRAVLALGTDEVLYVGDSDSDVLAAKRAGIDSAFVRRPHRQTDTLAITPTHEIRSLEGLARLMG